MIALALAALVSTSSAATPQAWLVLSRKSGVATPKALATVGEIQALLVGVPTVGTPEDLSSCKGKKVCVIDAARKKNVPVVVSIEVGAVLKDGTLRIEALSVEEDGRQLAVAEADGPTDALVAKVAPTIRGSFSEALRKALGLTPPPTPKVDPPPTAPLVVAPPPEVKVDPSPAPAPAATPVVTQPAEGPGFFTGGRIAGLAAAGVGVALVVVGGIFGAQAASGSARVKELCPMSVCTNPEAFTTWSDAKRAESTSLVMTIAGAVMAAGGAVIFFLNPGGDALAASALVLPVPGGAAGSFTLRF
ncbi:MAG: hypothetical protein SFW67_20090 [Myxococcaceae bacterium]|nr:hypothetical protein [Myxococcaceae bacterium]